MSAPSPSPTMELLSASLVQAEQFQPPPSDVSKPLSDQVFDLKHLVLMLLKVQRTMSDCLGDISTVVMMFGSKFEASHAQRTEDLEKLEKEMSGLKSRVQALEQTGLSASLSRRDKKASPQKSPVTRSQSAESATVVTSRSVSPPPPPHIATPPVLISTTSARIPSSPAAPMDSPGIRTVSCSPSVPRLSGTPVLARSKSVGILRPLPSAAAPLVRHGSWTCLPVQSHVVVEEVQPISFQTATIRQVHDESPVLREPVVGARARSSSPCAAGIRPGSASVGHPPAVGAFGKQVASCSSKGETPHRATTTGGCDGGVVSPSGSSSGTASQPNRKAATRLLPAHPENWPDRAGASPSRPR